MNLNSSSGRRGHKHHDITADIVSFDFVVAQRPKYIPNSGPPLAPISVMPPHDNKAAYIIDKVQFGSESRYRVGYHDKPNLKVTVRPENILDWVSPRTYENFEAKSYDDEIERQEREELAEILAKEERIRKRKEAAARAAQGIDGRKLKRKRHSIDGSAKKAGRPPKVVKSSNVTTRRGPGSRNQPDEEPASLSPTKQRRFSLLSQQPSLSRPSLSVPARGIADQSVTETESDDEGYDTDTAAEMQLKGMTGTGESSRSESVDLLRYRGDLPDRSRSKSRPSDASGEDRRDSASTRLNRKSDKLSTSDFYGDDFGKGAVAATSSRGFLKGYEHIERKKNPDAKSLNPAKPLNSTRKSLSPVTPAKPFEQANTKGRPAKATSLFKAGQLPSSSVKKAQTYTSTGQATTNNRSRTPSKSRPKTREPESESESESEEDDSDYYEVHEILNEEFRKGDDGKNTLFYLIDWVGNYAPTWEPAENVGMEAIKEFEERKVKALASKTSGADESEDELFVTPESNRKGSNGKGKGVQRGQLVDDDNDDDDDEGEEMQWERFKTSATKK
jgi:hypothetical protein